MVKNIPNSLRQSTSTISLRVPLNTGDDQFQAAQQQIAEQETLLPHIQAANLLKASEYEHDRILTTHHPQISGQRDKYIPPRFCNVDVPEQTLREIHKEWDADNVSIEGHQSSDPEVSLCSDHEEQKAPTFQSLFEKFNETVREQHQRPRKSLITKALAQNGNALKAPEAYTQPFCDFLTENPTVFHAVKYFEKKLEKAGFKKV